MARWESEFPALVGVSSDSITPYLGVASVLRLTLTLTLDSNVICLDSGRYDK